MFRFPVVAIEFVKRGLVRPLALVFCALAVIIGLPWLADFFREPLYPDSVTLSVDAPGVPARKADHTSTKPAEPSNGRKATGGTAAVAPAFAAKGEQLRISRPSAQGNVRQGEINLQAAQDC